MTTSGTYFGSTGVGGIISPDISSITYDGDVLTVKESLNYYVDDWENSTPIGEGIYVFKLTDQTIYSIISDYNTYMSSPILQYCTRKNLYVTI